MRALGFNDRIEVIPNGLRVTDFVTLPPADRLIERFPELKDRRWVVFLGRIHPQKGIVQAMQACFDLLAFADDWHLVIVGPDEIGLQQVLQAAITRKNLQSRVTFTGMLNREDVRALLGRASLLLQPSMSEGLSMSILEALAAGLPVLISTACNMPEVETEGAGRVVPPTRADLAYAMRGMVKQSKEALADMGRKARKLAEERFDWSKLIPKYRAMYARVAGR